MQTMHFDCVQEHKVSLFLDLLFFLIFDSNLSARRLQSEMIHPQKDHLSPLERQAVDAVKQQRRAMVTSSGNPPLMLNSFRTFAAEDVGLRRGIERVLEREAHLHEVRLQHRLDDVEQLRQTILELQLKRDRLTHLLQVTIPQKQRAVDGLREKIGIIEEKRMSKHNDRKLIDLSSAVKELMVTSRPSVSTSGAHRGDDVSFAASAWMTSESSSTSLRHAIETLIAEPQPLPDAADQSICRSVAPGDGDAQACAAQGGPTNELENELADCRASMRREVLRREVRDMFDLCVDATMSKQVSSWYRIASETICLENKLKLEQSDFPKYDDLKQNLDREVASRISLREEQDRQLQVGHDRLEEAHRAAFQNRKHMIAVHRRLTNDQSGKSKSLLESVRNELAMGKIDLLRTLCMEEASGASGNTSVTAAAVGSTSNDAKPTDSSRSRTATANNGSTKRSDATPPPAGGRFQASGTFTPSW